VKKKPYFNIKDREMREIKRIGWVGWIIALSLMLSPMIVHAWSEDLLSHFQAYIDIQEEYNSNINLTSNRYRQGDFITTITPGLKISTAPKSPVTGQFRQTPTAEEHYGIDLDFHTGFSFYAKNHEDNYISLNGLLNAWYALSKNLNFRVRDYLIRSDDIREPDYSANAIQGQYLLSRTGERTPWIRNVFEPSVQYEFGRKDAVAIDSLAIQYRNNVYKIQSRTGDSSVEHFVNPTLTYWFDIRHGVSFQYGLTLGSFEKSSDLVGHTATGRYTYRFNPITSIFGEYTQLWLRFEPPSLDYTVYRPSFGIQHAFSSTLSGKAQFGYFWQSPEKGPTMTGFYYDVSLSQIAGKTTYTLLSQGGYQEDYFTSQNRGLTETYKVLGRISHQLLQKMSVGLFSSYDWNKYVQSTNQTDRIWEIGGNASYKMLNWLAFSLDVSHLENHSNLSDGSYSEYRGMIKVTATY
jgi:hypothetical protein